MGVADDVARSLVQTANELRPMKPAYAILVRVGAIDDLTSDPACPVLSPDSAIGWRQGQRLVAVTGPVPDLRSFETFTLVLSSAFPEAEALGPDLKRLAAGAIEECIRGTPLEQDSAWQRSLVEEHLANCLAQLLEAHAAEYGVRLPWNVRWLEHVRLGL